MFYIIHKERLVGKRDSKGSAADAALPTEDEDGDGDGEKRGFKENQFSERTPV